MRALGTPFSGSPTNSVTGAFLDVPLTPGSYRWQARAVDASGVAGEWVAFGSTTADFVVTAGTSGGGSGGGGGGGGGGCSAGPEADGSMVLMALAIAALLAAWR